MIPFLFTLILFKYLWCFSIDVYLLNNSCAKYFVHPYSNNIVLNHLNIIKSFFLQLHFKRNYFIKLLLPVKLQMSINLTNFTSLNAPAIVNFQYSHWRRCLQYDTIALKEVFMETTIQLVGVVTCKQIHSQSHNHVNRKLHRHTIVMKLCLLYAFIKAFYSNGIANMECKH